MHDTKHVTTKAALLDGPEGRLQAVISTFDRVDSDGDVVLPTAFKDGQQVPMVWAHDWSRPIGKGVVTIEPMRAVWTGELFLDTAAGADAYTTIKRMGDLQEYSWGFQVVKASHGKFDGQDVRFLEQATVYEASPVLVGSNRSTGTLDLKDGGIRLIDHEALVHEQVPALIARWRSLDGRGEGKIGAAISRARRERIATLRDVLRSGADDLDALLAEVEPATEDDGKGRLLFAAFLRDEARRLGVAV